MLELQDIHVEVNGKEIIKGVSLQVNKGEKIALMGKNGSGKSTLSNALMGNPKYQITKGKVLLKGEDITHALPEARAKLGLFMSFQSPVEVSGVTLSQFLRLAYNTKFEKNLNPYQFKKLMKEKMDVLHVPNHFEDRYLNEDFSGGEKKKSEILQLLMLEPEFAILDETDSGLDVDALKVISTGINTLDAGFLVITHYSRILNELKPDKVIILEDGKITRQGDASLAHEIEELGFASR